MFSGVGQSQRLVIGGTPEPDRIDGKQHDGDEEKHRSQISGQIELSGLPDFI
jgi:hypothetical protein